MLYYKLILITMLWIVGGYKICCS